MKPAIGRIVLYVISEHDAALVRERRGEHAYHQGINLPVVGDILPLIICRVWDPELYGGKDSINGQVMLDGSGSHWVTSAHPCADKTPGTWHWPEIMPKPADSITRMDAELSDSSPSEINGIPRRMRTDLHTPAEAAITLAMAAVEEAGAHPLLTQAVMLLADARNKVADSVELPTSSIS